MHALFHGGQVNFSQGIWLGYISPRAWLGDFLSMHVLCLRGVEVPSVAREAIGLLCASLPKWWISMSMVYC